MAHNYLVTAQPATIVSNSHTGYFNSPDELNTILIKGNNIEIYTVSSDDGFQKINELPFYGRIIESLLFRPPSCNTDHLFILTQSYSYCIIATDSSTNQIITKASGTLMEDGNITIKRSAASLISIDSLNRNILIHIYKGEILLIRLDDYGKQILHTQIEKIIINELDILSLTFLYHPFDVDDHHVSIADGDANADDDNIMMDNDNNNDNQSNATQLQSAKLKIKSKLKKININPKKGIEKMKNLRKRSKSKDKNDNVAVIDEKKNAFDDDNDNANDNTNSSSVSSLLLCILYQDYRRGRHLKTYYINCLTFELETGPWDTLMVEEGCNKLIAIPPPLYGVIFIGQYSIAYRNGDNCQRVQVPDGDLCCMDCIDKYSSNNNNSIDIDNDNNQPSVSIVPGTRYLIGDGLNRSLNMLILRHSDNHKVQSLHFEKLGNIVSPCCISYICSGLAFIGSTAGDHQFIEIHTDKNWRKKLDDDDDNDDDDDDDDDITMNNNDANTTIDNKDNDLDMDNDNDDNDDKDNDVDDVDDGYVQILEEFTNLGPIVDMVSVDLSRQGQCQLVTCSGIGRDGSLRIIKNGIGIEEVACIEMTGICGLWALTENSNNIYHKYLITSFISETRILAMTDEGLEEVEMNGLNSKIRTIHCCNISNNKFIQISELNINLIDLNPHNNFNLLSTWISSTEFNNNNIKINSCSTNNLQILCALSSGNIALFEVNNNNKIILKSKKKLDHEISCISLGPILKNDSKSKYCAVGMWKDYSIRILSLNDFNIILSFPLQTDIVPRSVLITNFNQNMNDIIYLFVGMGDGSLIETKLKYNNNNNINNISLIKHKKIPLGTQPVRLIQFVCNNISYIFGGCDRPTVIYLLNNRMFYANVNLPEINYMTEFNANDFPDCLAMSVQGNLMIGTMDQVQKLHITKIALNQQPRRIAYNESNKCYLIATQDITNKKHIPNDQDTDRANYFHPMYNQTVYTLQLRDNQNIDDILYMHKLDPFWNITKIITHKFKCDPHVTYFIITSCLAYPHEKHSRQGKLQIAMVINDNIDNNNNDDIDASVVIANANATANILNDDDNNNNNTTLKMVDSKSFRGDPSCIRGIGDDYLLVGVRSKIQLFRWMLRSTQNDNEYPFTLHHLHTIHNNTFILDIKVHGDFFIIIDLMKSISMFLLQYTGHKSQNKPTKMIDGTIIGDTSKNKSSQYAAIITEVARDYDPSWMNCGELYNDQHIIGVDSYCNIFVLQRNINSNNDDERGRLDKVCRIHWGDDIKSIMRGSLVMDIPFDIETNTTATANNNNKMDVDNDNQKKKKKSSDKLEMDQDSDDDDDNDNNNDNDQKDDQKTNIKLYPSSSSSSAIISSSSYHLTPLKPTDLRKCVFGTIDGAIGVLISIPHPRHNILQKLENALRKFVQGLGGLDHVEWRQFKNQTEILPSVGFLDGDLIETFLNLTNDQQNKVAADMKIETEALIKIVEEMNRLH